MSAIISRHDFTSNNHKTSYLAAGPKPGPLLIFIHGWPGVAETWIRQIKTFASLGFYTVAPDCRGYGYSDVSKDASDYRLEVLVEDALKLLSHLGHSEAVWIGHDWGSGIVWALAAHHPEACRAVVNLAVPYHTLEYGLDCLLSLTNRDIYPANVYPNGQWDYQAFYESNSERVTKQFERNVANSIKACYLKANHANFGKPARTARITSDGGWFGGADSAPDIPLSNTVFADDSDLHKTISDAMSRTGFFGATSYYLNHAANATYAQRSVNGGFLKMPCMFIEARHDGVLATNMSQISAPMRRYCCDLTECSIDAAHWVQLEKPQDVNAALARVRMHSNVIIQQIALHFLIIRLHILTFSSGWQPKLKTGGQDFGRRH
jgi:soluble epoxide hydrolase/lipid-phosphate phosphatase